MGKKLVIHKCEDCPYFDNQYYTYERECTKLDQKNNVHGTILDNCPLEDENGFGEEIE